MSQGPQRGGWETGIYGCLWVFMGIYGYLQVFMGVYGFIL